MRPPPNRTPRTPHSSPPCDAPSRPRPLRGEPLRSPRSAPRSLSSLRDAPRAPSEQRPVRPSSLAPRAPPIRAQRHPSSLARHAPDPRPTRPSRFLRDAPRPLRAAPLAPPRLSQGTPPLPRAVPLHVPRTGHASDPRGMRNGCAEAARRRCARPAPKPHRIEATFRWTHAMPALDGRAMLGLRSRKGRRHRERGQPWNDAAP